MSQINLDKKLLEMRNVATDALNVSVDHAMIYVLWLIIANDETPVCLSNYFR